MLKIKRSYRLLLSAILLVGILLLQFHFHDHAQSSEECPICIIYKVLDLSDVPKPFVALFFLAFVFIPFVRKTSLHTFVFHPNTQSRAPPSFS